MICAAYYGHAEAVGLLVQARADLERANIWKYTGLQMSALNGHTKALQMLIEAKADLEATDGQVSPERTRRASGYT